jgi:hypothetical protein
MSGGRRPFCVTICSDSEHNFFQNDYTKLRKSEMKFVHIESSIFLVALCGH